MTRRSSWSSWSWFTSWFVGSSLAAVVVLPVACGDSSQQAALLDTPRPDGFDAAGPKRDLAADLASDAGRCLGQCHCEATSPRPAAPEVAVLPDEGEAPFVDLLSGADESIRVMVYLMGYGAILDTLEEKARQGVSVEVILDEGKASVNQKYRDRLEAAGAEVRWSDPKFSYMHAKMIIVDEEAALITTGNFSAKYSILRERNFVTWLSDPDDVADMVALFDADWRRDRPQLDCTRLLVSPINARQRLIELIDSATEQLTIESMQLADKEVRAHVAAREQAGVEVRVILADDSWIDANADAAAFLDQEGIEARWIPHCHTKVIVADRQRAYLGSVNLSYTSLNKNREVGLVLTSPAPIAVLTDTFERDWAAATEF